MVVNSVIIVDPETSVPSSLSNFLLPFGGISTTTRDENSNHELLRRSWTPQNTVSRVWSPSADICPYLHHLQFVGVPIKDEQNLGVHIKHGNRKIAKSQGPPSTI
jgi:hypothetical protein